MQKKQNAVLTETERGRDKIEIEELEKKNLKMRAKQNKIAREASIPCKEKIRKEGKIKSEQFHKTEI